MRHPGDVVAAAITIQRFMRRIKKNNELRKAEEEAEKKKKSARRTRKITESSVGKSMF